MRVLTPPVVSPTLASQLQDFLTRNPEAGWCVHEPLGRDAAMAGARMAFGEPVNAVYDFSQADVIVSLDCDFLTAIPGHLRYTRDFAQRRRVRTSRAEADSAEMNRLYVIESALSSTGAKADHRLAVRGSQVYRTRPTVGLATRITGRINSDQYRAESIHAEWTNAVAKDLQDHRGRSLGSGRRSAAARSAPARARDQ